LLDLFGSKGKGGQQFDDNFHEDLCHYSGRRNFGIDIEPLDIFSDELEQVEGIGACLDVLHTLEHQMSQETHTRELRKTHTARRIPIAANINFTGGKGYRIGIRYKEFSDHEPVQTYY
jgi:hypothetical protein